MPLRSAVVAVLILAAGCGWIRRGSRDGSIDVRALLVLDSIHKELEDYSDRFILRTTSAASQIENDAEDLRTRSRSVAFKLVAVGLCRDTVFQEDVRLALIDSWAFAVQMREFFETGEGRDAFSAHTIHMVEAAKAIETDITSLAHRVLPSDSVAGLERAVRQFAKDFPIELPFARTSITSNVETSASAATLNSLVDTTLQPLRAIGGMDHTAQAVRDVASAMREVTFVTKQLPLVIQWHSELLLYHIEGRGVITSTLGSLEKASLAAESLARTASELPAEIRRVLQDAESQQAALQKTMVELRTTIESGQKAIDLVDKTSANVAVAGAAWEKTIHALRTMIEGFSAPPPEGEAPPAPEEPPGRPFDILDYAHTADSISRAASELRQSTAELQRLLGSEELKGTLEAASSRLAWLAVIVAAALAVALTVVAVVWVVALRWSRTRAVKSLV